MKLIKNLIRLVATALVLLLILLGVAATAFVDGSPEERLSTLVNFVVPAALLVQILLFHQMEGQLTMMAERMERLGNFGDNQAGQALPAAPGIPTEAAGNPPVSASKKAIQGSGNPPPAPYKTDMTVARQPAPYPPPALPTTSQASAPTSVRREEVPPYEDLAANRRATNEIWEELDRRAAVESAPPAGGRLAPAREGAAAAADAKSAVLDAAEIVQAWNRYLADGNGYFDGNGLQEFLAAAGIRAAVVPPESLIGLGAPVLGVCELGSRERVFLLPDFTRPPKALAAYFDLDSEIKNSTRMNRLVRAAELRRNGGQYELRQRGALE